MTFNSQSLDSRGALWRKWDLHFHTPASFDYRRADVSNQQIVDGLINNQVSVVAITDHHRIDPERIMQLRELAAGRIVFLPGIELRCELGGSASIHYIGLFPESIDVHELWTSLQGKLDLSPSSIKKIGDDKFYVKHEIGTSVIRELGGLVSIHAGTKSNSIEGIKNVPKFKQTVKTDILRENVDLLELSRVNDCSNYRNVVFPSVGFSRPIVVGSDNHDIQDYSVGCPCWIRGDASFDTLKHLCCEPDDRVYLGTSPTQHDRVSGKKTKYIRSIDIRKTTDSSLSEKWFDCNVQLNHGLVAIIGNKGGGKSALADIIGLLGNSQSGSAFSFLTSKKFCKPSQNKSKSFEASIEWETGLTEQRKLSDSVNAEIESVRYLPQEYIESICNELQQQGTGRFSEELASVIFSHVDSANRLGCATFDELLEYKSAERRKAVDVQRESLEPLLRRLVNLEERSSPTQLKKIAERIESKEREIASHDADKPEIVLKPVEDDEALEKTAAAEKRLLDLDSQIEQIELQKAKAGNLASIASRRVAACDRLTTRVESLSSAFNQFLSQSKSDCVDIGIEAEQVATLKLNLEPVSIARTEAVVAKAKQEGILKPEIGPNFDAQVLALQHEMTSVREELALPSQKYQKYLAEHKAWETKRLALIGSVNTEDTLSSLKNELSECKAAAHEIPAAFELVLQKSLAVYDELTALAQVYSELYAPVQGFIERHPLAISQFQMSFQTNIVEKGFATQLLSNIAQNRKGSFCGSVEGNERCESLLACTDFNDRESVKQFLKSVWRSLHFDLRLDETPKSEVSDQLSRKANLSALFRTIFQLSYLDPFFTLKWAGKNIDQLSPGERGTLLLVFYLLIDRSDIPLIIDQPEENLDNQTVFNVLVPSIKEARDRRQLIIVTHNPNLAVVCDADQVICATVDKEDGNRVHYESGSIENPKINRLIMDILEGTRPAFENRDSKYHPSAF